MIYFKNKEKLYKWNIKGLIKNSAQVALVATVMMALSVNLDAFILQEMLASRAKQNVCVYELDFRDESSENQAK